SYGELLFWVLQHVLLTPPCYKYAFYLVGIYPSQGVRLARAHHTASLPEDHEKPEYAEVAKAVPANGHGKVGSDGYATVGRGFKGRNGVVKAF
ncbi:hypothetical protein HK104_001226, partial [Borealophlyctis nickersoniae]